MYTLKINIGNMGLDLILYKHSENRGLVRVMFARPHKVKTKYPSLFFQDSGKAQTWLKLRFKFKEMTQDHCRLFSLLP